jgi:hypothetical protein
MKKRTIAPRTKRSRRPSRRLPYVSSVDWFAPEELSEIERELVAQGKEKYHLDEKQAIEWAKAFCRREQVSRKRTANLLPTPSHV